MTLTQETVKELLTYDKETGFFTWCVTRNGYVKKGDLAGHIHKKGYIRLLVLGQKYFAHRLAWFYSNGVWPVGQIDHINGERDDNRLLNLREVTNRGNQQNSRKHRSRNGLIGACLKNDRPRIKPWYSRICIEGGPIHLGYFATELEAHLAYCQAHFEWFGTFPIKQEGV